MRCHRQLCANDSRCPCILEQAFSIRKKTFLLALGPASEDTRESA